MQKLEITLLLLVVIIMIAGCTGQALLEEQNLKNLAANKLDKEAGELTKEDLQQIKNLKVTGPEGVDVQAVKSLTGIKYLSQLKALSLKGNKIMDITPLKDLTELRYLDLSNNQIKDIKTLSNLDKLMYLDISNNDLDISSGSETMKIIKKLRKKGTKVRY